MMHTCWRICKSAYRQHAFDGEGARKYGGRWYSPGKWVVCAAEALSLAALEMLVHAETESALQNQYIAYPIEFNAKLCLMIPEEDLPSAWKTYPYSSEVQAIGNEWFETAASALLQVPSVIIPRESNFLINPKHSDYRKLKIGQPVGFNWDSRFVR